MSKAKLAAAIGVMGLFLVWVGYLIGSGSAPIVSENSPVTIKYDPTCKYLGVNQQGQGEAMVHCFSESPIAKKE